MADLTQETFEVKVDDQTFVFRIPSPRDMARMGSRALLLRRQDSPDTMGSEWGLDGFSSDLYRGMALMETLLLRADAKDNWPYTEKDGKPVVDSSKFPPSSTLLIPLIYRGFDEQLTRFHSGGAGDGQQSGEEAVGSMPSA
jgi:hypothetical protein